MKKLPKLLLPKPFFLVSVVILIGAAYLLGWSKIFVVEKITVDSQINQ